MKAEFTSFTSSDGLLLPGLLYAPKAHKRVAIWLHGMGDSGAFYNPTVINALADALHQKNIAFFAFNNRGAHNRKNLKYADTSADDERYTGGTHYERIIDCVHDINGAVRWLQEKGFSEFYLIGHSTGANKICAYDHLTKNNLFVKYVLSGPGDDSGNSVCELGEKKFWRALDYARKAIIAGKPLQRLPKYTGMYPFSAQAADDILDPDGAYNTFPFYEATTKRLGKKPLFKEFSAITKPMLVLFGEKDEYTYTAGGTHQALGLLKNHTSKQALPHSQFQIIPEADHSFRGHEQTYAKQIASWLAAE